MNNTTATLDAVNNARHFIKVASTHSSNSTGTRDYGTFQIHASTRLFPIPGVTYMGDKETLDRVRKENKEKLQFICGMYGIGGQSLTCDEGVKLEDGSFIYNGSYDCWSD